MTTLDREALWMALDRYSQVESVFASDRVCLASSQGNLPDLRGRDGFIVHWTSTGLPWFLWPLSLIVSSGRCAVELTHRDRVTAFARAADECFTVSFHSFSRALLPSVLGHLRSDGWNAGLGVACQDATYAELEFNCDGDDHERVLVLGRGNRDCPPDLSRCLGDIYDLEDGSGDP
jgi:hypothetical protein